MLILARKAGESVVIAEGVYCKILYVNGNYVHLGFEAPRAVTINREEIHEQNLIEQQSGAPVEEVANLNDTIIDQLITQFKKPQLNTLATH